MNGTPGPPFGESDGAEAERRLALLGAYSRDVLCETRDGLITYITPNTASVSGISPDALIGRRVQDMVHPDDWGALAPFLAPGWTGEIEATFRVAEAGGGWHWREAHGRREVDDAGVHSSVLVLRDIAEHRRAQDAVAESEARSVALLTAIPDLMFRITRDGRYVDFKADRKADLYANPDEIIGSYVRDLLPADVAEAVMSYMDRALDEGGVHTVEYRLPRGGEVRDHEARFTASGDDEVVLISRDITARKRAERELVESERKYRNMIEGARDVVYAFDLEGNFTGANAMATTVFGYTNEEILQLNIGQIVDPKHIPIMLENAAFAMRGERIGEPVEYLTYAKDGSTKWVEVVATPIMGEGGVVGFQGIARDISERRRAEEQIHFQAQLLDGISQGVFAVDGTGTIIFWNKRSEELYGLTSEQTIGLPITEFKPTADRPDAIEAYEHMLRAEDWTGEVLVRTRDGRSFPVLVATGPILDEGGARIGVACVTAEITSLKEAQREAQLAHEQAALAQERARIAQELHDSVAQYFFGIGIAAKELSERENASPALVKRRLAHVKRLSAQGGREIRNAILTLAPPEPAPDLERALAPLLDELRASGVAVRFTRRMGRPIPDGERSLLYSAGRELLFNVRKHAGATRVHVQLTSGADMAELSVSDDGSGRAGEVRARMDEGSGYGLHSLRARLQQRGGSLAVASRKGGGVRVSCALPLGAER